MQPPPRLRHDCTALTPTPLPRLGCLPHSYDYHMIETAARGCCGLPKTQLSPTFPAAITEKLVSSLTAAWTSDMISRGYTLLVRHLPWHTVTLP